MYKYFGATILVCLISQKCKILIISFRIYTIVPQNEKLHVPRDLLKDNDEFMSMNSLPWDLESVTHLLIL